jgi:hypothetical protein
MTIQVSLSDLLFVSGATVFVIGLVRYLAARREQRQQAEELKAMLADLAARREEGRRRWAERRRVWEGGHGEGA